MNELCQAILKRDGSRAETLISSGDIDINECDPTGGTPLIYASGLNFFHIVDMLVERGVDLAAMNYTGSNALHVCATHGGSAIASSLVGAGADVEAVNGISGGRPLQMAAESGNLEVVEVLLGAGAMVDATTPNGATPIFLASRSGRDRVVGVLLRAKANWKLTYLGLTALGVAVSFQQNAVLREFQEQVGFQPGVTYAGQAGPGFLKFAAEVQNIGMMSILCNGGVLDSRGEALGCAVTFGREESVKFLLQKAYERGVGVENSTLECCFAPNCLKPRILRRLIDAGVDVTNPNVVGETTGETGETDGRLEAMVRLLKQVPAIRGVSWGWPAGESSTKTKTKTLVVKHKHLKPKPRVVLAALFRKKTDSRFVGLN